MKKNNSISPPGNRVPNFQYSVVRQNSFLATIASYRYVSLKHHPESTSGEAVFGKFLCYKQLLGKWSEYSLFNNLFGSLF